MESTLNMLLPQVPPPPLLSNAHDLLLDCRPKHAADDLHAYTDLEWATCSKTRRLVGGANLRLAGGTIAHKSKLQPMVAQSSTEAEFTEAADCGKMILFCQSILWDLGVPQCTATVAYEDNDDCRAMANAQKPTPRVRHMDIKYNVLCEWVERDLIVLERVNNKLNMADHFTKQPGPFAFRRHTDYILGHVPPEYSACFQLIHGLL